jgi:hypothetical protein
MVHHRRSVVFEDVEVSLNACQSFVLTTVKRRCKYGIRIGTGIVFLDIIPVVSS